MTSLPSITLLGARIAIVLGVSAALAPVSALAELQVGGTPNAVTIDAQNSSVKEVLDALGKTFDVHVQSTANLEKQLTGTYEGSLPRVLTRVLEGYNVIMRTNKDRIEITVLGTRSGSGTGSVSTTPTIASAAPSAPAANVAAAPAANVSNTDKATPVTQAAVSDANLPTPTPSVSSSSPMIVLAEGAAPPVPSAPSADSGENAFPIGKPTTAEPPTATQSSTPATFPMGAPTTTMPKAPTTGTDTSGPQPGTAGVNSGSLAPTKQ